MITAIIITAFIIYLISMKKMHEERFSWYTRNGIEGSKATLYKLRGLPFYRIQWECDYRKPSEHPDYKNFLEKVKEIKNR